jgi:hypothetical protein
MPEHKDLTGSDLHEPKGIEIAPQHTVYEADGAGSGNWVYAVSSVHAEMIIESNVTPEVVPTAVDITLATDSDYTKLITGWTAGHVLNMTFNSDELVIAIDGTYEIHAWFNILLPSNNQKVAVKYAINDTAPYSVRKLITNSSSAGDIVSFSGSAFAPGLVAGDTLSVYIATDLAGDPTVLEGGLMAKLLDQTV